MCYSAESSLISSSSSSPSSKCSYCHKIGHNENKCFIKYPDLIKCTKCKQNGHFWRQCPKLKEKANQVNYNNDELNKNYKYNYISSDDENIYTPVIVYKTNYNNNHKYANKWISDSGATKHMCNDRLQFQSYMPIKHRDVIVANGANIPAIGMGDIIIYQYNQPHRLTNVLHVPDLNCNLLSIFQLQKHHYSILFSQYHLNKVLIYNKHNRIVMSGTTKNDLYIMNFTTRNQIHQNYKAFTAFNSANIWHQRLNHISRNTLHAIKNDININIDNNNDNNCICSGCAQGKIKRSNKITQRSTDTFK